MVSRAETKIVPIKTISPNIWKAVIERGEVPSGATYDPMTDDQARAQGVYPNHLVKLINYPKVGAKIAALLASKSSQGDDHAVGKIPLELLVEVRQKDQIEEGHLVLYKRDGGRMIYVNGAPILDLPPIVAKLELWPGKKYGPHWWIKESIYLEPPKPWSL
jgi:hypothetical protein